MKAPASAGTDSEGETNVWKGTGDDDFIVNIWAAQQIPYLIEIHLGTAWLTAFAKGGAA
ncbi:MAG: hypothetical protein ACK5NN_07440 [Sphingomonadaceae bacterium]